MATAAVSPAKSESPDDLSEVKARRWLRPLITSSVGAKYLVALTGLALVAFVIGHLAGNLQVYAGPDAINKYAQTLKDLGPLLWLARLGLLAVFVLHISLGV